MSQPRIKSSAIQKQLEYWRAYGMENDPFDNSSIEGRFFWGEEREELLRKALQLACCATQAIAFYGPKGIGKTKFRLALEERLEDDEQIVVVSLPAGPMTTPQQLLAQLGEAFDLPAEQLEPAELEVQIKECLQANENSHNTLVILVDDADRLPEFTLASLLVMATYPDNYISVLMFAATDSNGVLRAELQNQQIQQFEIPPFDAFTLESYLRYRLDLVGGDRYFPFSADDIDELLQLSGGIPRQVDELARKKLLAALQPQATDGSRFKSKRAALSAIKIPHVKLPAVKIPNITLPKLSMPQVSWQPLAAVAGLLLFVGGAWLFSGGAPDKPTKPKIASTPIQTQPEPEPGSGINSDRTPDLNSEPKAKAEATAVDPQWLDQALAMAPAAGKPIAGSTIALASTALPRSAPVQADAASPSLSVDAIKKPLEPTVISNAANASDERQTASKRVELAAVKVKQKYIDKAKAALPEDEVYILKSPKSSYTLQLLGSSSKVGMRDFITGNKNIDILVFEEQLEGRPWFVAVTGSFDSVEQARDGLAELPSALRELKPWPRQFSSVQADIRRHRQR